jgi:hypothetical protein
MHLYIAYYTEPFGIISKLGGYVFFNL